MIKNGIEVRAPQYTQGIMLCAPLYAVIYARHVRMRTHLTVVVGDISYLSAPNGSG
jgi:hypothetical protein